ncbi:hypothetical protein AJ80_03375 [Polytolypa hystricis UAMH7299]|uniref:PPIase cyclophilin-type domain-containing protein n=1 Tax=Polytolypa hystricis (strain UAMH7299) TaxID=1447883 RepID=A0A2B7YB86_POLH7|nr:hypothetical protein AJ80_03375 [Polytolypa hystricis UAMH7299]
MSSHYNTEPPPTASATLHTTAGPIHISLFAKQTPLACKNFLQHCLDGYFNDTIFHRIVPSFVIQGGDPTGSGSGGSSIYEDAEFEIDARTGEKVEFKDELHSRLKFNRRGLVGMAKSEDGSYGSQFFVTLGNADRELTGTCTMFGRLEGDSIYAAVKIAEGELVEGTERPVYAVKITGCEVDELGPFKDVLRKREKIAAPQREAEEKKEAPKKKKKAKARKPLLSFAGDDDDEEDGNAVVFQPSKPKFNTRVVAGEDTTTQPSNKEKQQKPHPKKPEPISAGKRKRPRSPSLSKPPPITRKPPPPPRDPNSQLPLPDPESPTRSPSPSSFRSRSSSRSASPHKQSKLERTNAEIAALKASMTRRDMSSSAAANTGQKESALEAMIPESSIRGRRRPAQGTSTANNGMMGSNSLLTKQERDALKQFQAFKARLEGATSKTSPRSETATNNGAEKERRQQQQPATTADADADTNAIDEEAQLCDLHFIANCQSCRAWDTSNPDIPTTTTTTTITAPNTTEDTDARDWMTHTLSFGKDMLGKDLSWKRKNADADGLVVIDPREKEREIVGERGRGGGGGVTGGGRGRERERMRKMAGGAGGAGREWDRERKS